MLKQRVVTALVLLVIIGAPALLLPVGGFFLLAVAVFSMASWEWSLLAGFETPMHRAVYVALTAVLLLALAWLAGLPAAPLESVLKTVFLVAGIWWGIALLWVQTYPASTAMWQGKAVRATIGWLVILPSCLALVWMRSIGPDIWLVIYLVALVVAADVGAYFFGKAYGEKKMAPRVSPGKSWAGLAGGVLCGTAFALLIALVFSLPLSMGQWLVISIVTVLSSVIGDLLESMLKRHCGVKDSGNILPGHGGVLDRLDGWTAAAPVFALCLLSVGWPS